MADTPRDDTPRDDLENLPADAPERPSRRKALQAAIRFTSVMSALGLSAGTLLSSKTARAASSQADDGKGPCNPDVLEQLINHAIANEDMEAAIDLYGAESGLSAEALDALRTITPDDLHAVNELSASVTGAIGDSNITAETYAHVIVHVDNCM